MWRFEEKGNYTVKSGYRVLSGLLDGHVSMSKAPDELWWKGLWSLKLPPKILHFGWRLFQGFLSVDMQLKRHHVPVTGICWWCRGDWGSIGHTLLFCPTIKEVWKCSSFWQQVSNSRGRHFDEVILLMWNTHDRRTFRLWLVMLWLIWGALCRAKHDGILVGRLGWEETANKFLCQYEEARAALAATTPRGRKLGADKWQPPPMGEFRVDVDALFNPKKNMFGVEVIVRDDKGKVKAAWSKPIGTVNSALQGELIAMLNGVGLSLQYKHAPMHVFSNSALLTRLLQDDK